MKLKSCILVMILYLVPSIAGGEVLYEGDSIYHHITINQNDKVRCMLFGRYKDNRETCINLEQADVPMLEYTEMMFVGFLFNGNTNNVLLLGLGGGYIPLVFQKHLSEVSLTVVEIDPEVHRLAKEYFEFRTSPTVNLIIEDGRQALKKHFDMSFDQIWVDVFNSDYIPSHMTTKEFLVLAKSKLSENGVIVQNVFNNNKLYDSQVRTFQHVFKYVYVLRGTRSSNSIIVASDYSTYSIASNNLKRMLNSWIGQINISDQFKKIIGTPEISDGEILTDDFSPANLLLHNK